VGREPDSLLSLTDFNGNPLAEELLWSSYRSLMACHGYVLMVNVPDSFDPVGFCKQVGEFVPQYTGVLVGDVRPEPGMDEFYHAGNSRPLYPHSEGYDFDGIPPRYLALWCVKPNTGAGGETTLADGYAWIDTLADADRQYLRSTIYEWETTDAMRHLGLDLLTEHPVIDDHPDGVILRYSFNNLVRGDDERIGPLLDSTKAFFERNHVAIQYKRHDMLVFDNWRMLHARNAFTDLGRHLRRIQIAHRAAA
jgi:alpha-ketoglutarate-dependent taurine dioxygenase